MWSLGPTNTIALAAVNRSRGGPNEINSTFKKHHVGFLNSQASSGSNLWQPLSFPAEKVEPGLREAILRAPDQQSAFLVYLKEQADLSAADRIGDWTARGEYVYETLWGTAQQSQAQLTAYLNHRRRAGGVSSLQSYYIVNAILVTADADTLDALAARPDVAYIEAVKEYSIPEPIPGEQRPPMGIEWGVAKIKADQVWSDFGIEGSGIVVANIDTGVTHNHATLLNQYRGTATGSHDYNWFDPTGIYPTAPGDNNGHGTHVMGTMVGDDGGSNQIGVAPGAQWIAAKGCATSTCYDSHLLAAAQWVLAPYPIGGTPSNGDPSRRPHVVNNSWGDRVSNTWYQGAVNAWRAANIFPAFSAGNSGPNTGTVSSPGDYAQSFASGATNNSDTIASFSSRGPSSLTSETKPDVSAPGVNIRSAWYNGGYNTISGTSMASPHTAGCVALIRAAAPALNITAIENLLMDTAVDRGATGSDYDYGHGRIDCYAAVAQVCSSSNCGGNNPPNTPAPQSPFNGYVATNGLAPTLSWRNNSDPDGDSVFFYAEVYNSPVNVNSGWISNYSWRPSQLDGDYHTYNWRVKAKDSHGAESDWSTTWQFTIQEANQPPSISFDTANGDSFSSGQIDDNDTTWVFQGTASDADGSISQIEYRCTGDDCGDYHTQSGLSNWTYERHSLSGRNDIYFRAYDNDNDGTFSRHLDLRIDLAKPNTSVSLNNEGNPANWPTWFRQSVQVRLQATDQGSGRARSDIDRIHYRVNGGSWQTNNSRDVSFTLSSDGVQSVEYYAVDNVGNQESTQTVTFQIDQTPPTPPSGVNETHGIINDQWQKDHDTPTFTWNESTDATAGLWGYQFYFGTDANGTSNHKTLLASDPRQWTPSPDGVATGTYYLRGRTRDNAGNWSNWADLFTFRYDGIPPHNPEVSNDDGLVSGVWQNNIRTADFSWQPAQDTGSGVAGYYIYWGPDENATSTSLSTANEFVSTTPICGENDACTHYLRLQTEDNAGWKSEWVTAFALRYDNAPPTAELVANYGVIQTNHTTIRLDINASDEGSGVKLMRLSNEGTVWTEWQPLESPIYWDIPAVGRRDYDILLQVADAIPLFSDVVSDTVLLDVNQPRPKSENFWLWTDVWNAGSNRSDSLSYQVDGSVGQSLDSAHLNSADYQIFSGYHAAALAVPTQTITYTHYTQLGQVIGSAGTPADGIDSATYQLMGTLGQSAHVQTISGISYTIDSGYWGGMVPSEPSEDPPPPPPPPPAQPDCEYFQFTINNGALYTNDAAVNLNLCGPYVSEVKLSNDGGFDGALWQPYTTTIPWTLDLFGHHVFPRIVYAQFKDEQGQIHGNFFDDIVYDPDAPTDANISVGDSIPQTLALRSLSRDAQDGESEKDGSFLKSQKDGIIRVANMRYTERVGEQVLAQPLPLLAPDANGTVDLYLSASDDNSGVAEMQISATSAFTDTEWQTYSAYQAWTPQGEDGVKTVYARFRDNAGNISAPVHASFVLDTSSPEGDLTLPRPIAGSDFITLTLNLPSADNLTAVTDMRVSTTPTFTDAPWQAYNTTLTWPIYLTGQSEETVYVEYRDAMGNISHVYSDTYLVDSTPPVVNVEVAAANSYTRTITVSSYDVMAQVETMHLSNDPLMIEDVVTLPYTETVEWVFDKRKIVWVQVEDSVGNLSEPYPAYIGKWLSSMILQPGWNEISSPLSPQVSYTAESLCQEINGQGGNVVEIDRFINGGWSGHICGLPFNDFDIEMGNGYFIKSNATSNWSIEGYQVTEALSLTLQLGWNPIGISHTDAYSAESLCDDIIAQGVTVVEIDRWYNGGWQGHICGLPFNDFNIQPGTGYFIKSESSGTVTPSELPSFP